MAVMWPEKLPREVSGNTLRNTECVVFKELKAALDDSFVVFYSRHWHGLKPNGEEIDGECDFIVAHADYGILTLEVKGGAVAYDPSTGRWTSRDRQDVVHRIKNPVQQARDSKYELLKKLKASTRWKLRRIQARHGVVLPHSSTPSDDLGADMPLRIFCFCERFPDDFGGWIMERFGDATPDTEARGSGWMRGKDIKVLEGKGLLDSRTTKGLGDDCLEALQNILAKPFQLRTPLRILLSQDDVVLTTLTQQQFHLLLAIEEIQRAAISGGAGTGKTVLAIEEALRCTENGARTLFVCYNRGLSMEVQPIMQDNPRLDVMTFHALCWKLIECANLLEQADKTAEGFYEEIMPRLAIQALKCLGDDFKYDAVIVDEGQDFHPLWWETLEAAFDSEGAEWFRVFYDNNQRIYPGKGNLPKNVELASVRLTCNLRNTQRIHELICQHYAGHEIMSFGPEGVEVDWVKAERFSELVQKISERVVHLTAEGIALDDIAVLADSKATAKKIAPKGCLGKFRVTLCDRPLKGRLIVDSIRRFKGLDRPVVILAATQGVVSSMELSYVALSRARTYLIIVGAEKELDYLKTGGL